MKTLTALTAFVVPFAITTGAFAADGAAPAGDPAAPPAVAAPAPVNVDKAPTAEPAPEFKHLTLTANPLSIAIGRFSANVEYLPIPHHAIVVNPYYWGVSVDASGGGSSASTKYTSFGGELGYHFYTGNKGANGFFVGPSLVVMNTSVSTSASTASSSSSDSSSIFAYGAAIDLGGQHVFDNGFTIGGGAGVMFLTASNTNTASSSTFKVSGTLPRILFTIGYSF